MLVSILATVWLLFICAATPPFSQYKSMITNEAFKKRIKIKSFLRHLFRAPNGASVKKDGIAPPSFAFQVFGYVLCLILTVLNVIFSVRSESAFRTMVTVTFFIVLGELVALCIWDWVFSFVGRRKKKNLRAIKFVPVKAEIEFTGEPIIVNNDIVYRNAYQAPGVITDAVQFGGWGQELDVIPDTRALVRFGAVFAPKKVKAADLRIPETFDAVITVEPIIDAKKPLPIYYDEQTGWYCFGNKDFSGKGYRFATDTVAVLSDGRLEAILIHPRRV